MSAGLTELSPEIERLSVRRQELWASGEDSSEEVRHLTKTLADLYEAKRTAMAGAGSKQARDRVMRRQRIEGELEDLVLNPERVRELHRTGKTVSEIAVALDFREATITASLKRLGLDPN